MIAAGLFSESMALDVAVIGGLVTILGAIGGGLIWVITMLKEQKKTRAEEIHAVVTQIINASPNKVVVDPQPFLVKMEEDFIGKTEFSQLVTRVAALEIHRHNDQMSVMKEIGKVPLQVIALLKETKGLI